MDHIEIAKKLIGYRSITPADGGSRDFISEYLGNLGFRIIRQTFGEVQNLYAEFGAGERNLCFAGHVDVVPAGDIAAWYGDPFSALIEDNIIYGRGVVDMKGAIASFLEALKLYLADYRPDGKISLLITSDEEGPSQDGTKKMLEFLYKEGVKLSHALVGEPTNPNYVGEMIKNGRRGSISFHLTIHGKQGHVAYPRLADNPIDKLINILAELKSQPLDSGTEHFAPSNLEIVNLKVDNQALNIIPQEASTSINIRFNELQDFLKLENKIKEICDKYSDNFSLIALPSAEVFLCEDESYSNMIQDAVEEELGIRPVVSTEGGTSDARFIKNYCPVVEFGLVNKTAHQVNESIEIGELAKLSRVYYRILYKYFGEEW